MLSLLIVLLSAFVLALSGAVVILARRLHAAEKGGGTVKPRSAQPERAEVAVLRQQRERAARLCMDIKRSLTHIHTTAPSAIPGLSIEHIRLLCADELKDRVHAVLSSFQNGFTDRLAQGMDGRDFARLDELIGLLASISEDVRQMDEALAPLFKTWSRGSTIPFDAYEQRLAAVSQRLEELHQQVQALLRSVSGKRKTDEAVLSAQERIRQASLRVSDPKVRAALDGLEALVREHYDALERQTKARVESYYLETLELALEELSRAEQAGEDTNTRAQLSIRVIQVLSHVVTAGQQAQREISERSLEAEVVALERLAVLHGDDVQGDSGLHC